MKLTGDSQPLALLRLDHAGAPPYILLLRSLTSGITLVIVASPRLRTGLRLISTGNSIGSPDPESPDLVSWVRIAEDRPPARDPRTIPAYARTPGVDGPGPGVT